MSRAKPSDTDELALEYPCTYCGVDFGEWCRTRSGNLANWLHGARTYPISQARHQGWKDGRHTVLCALADAGSDDPRHWTQRWIDQAVADHIAAADCYRAPHPTAGVPS